MAMIMAEFKEYMEANTNKRLNTIDDKMSGMQATVTQIDKVVRDNSDKIERHDGQIAEIRAEVSRLKTSQFPALPPASQGGLTGPAPAAAQAPVVSEKEEREYLLARRSLRIWPIPGNTNDDLWDATAVFMGTNLGLEGRINEAAIESINQVEIPSGPGVKHEVLIRFKEAVSRDLVLGASSKLAPYMDTEGKATAGMRLEVPPKLQQPFRILFKYGQNLRARHGPGTRRHVKFSDHDRSLFLNAKLPGDETWSRISVDVATRGLRARDSISDSQLEKRMDITGPFQSIQRPKSTSGTSTAASTSAWARRATGSTS